MYIRESTGQYRRASRAEIMGAAERVIRRRHRRGSLLDSSGKVRDYLYFHLAGREYETFCVLYLDNKNHLLAFVRHFNGTIDSASVYPRVIVKEALQRNAAAVILAHNHPSGIAEPSTADRNITTAIEAALRTVDIRVLDHFVIGADIATSVSFSERGYL